MGNTRDLFKKTRETKGTFHAEMGFFGGSESKESACNAGDPKGE